jgi:hypothetical protein
MERNVIHCLWNRHVPFDARSHSLVLEVSLVHVDRPVWILICYVDIVVEKHTVLILLPFFGFPIWTYRVKNLLLLDAYKVVVSV